MILLRVWMWESVQNLPLLLGFVCAARVWQDQIGLGLLLLLAGNGLGILIMHYTEPKLHKVKYAVNWKGDLINFVLFTVIAIPFIYYFNADNRWINWKTDLIAGIAVGILLTAGQSLSWSGEKSRMVLHGIAMAVSFPLIMICLRYTLQVEAWPAALLLTLLTTLLASLVIALIDYQEMYRKQASSPPLGR